MATELQVKASVQDLWGASKNKLLYNLRHLMRNRLFILHFHLILYMVNQDKKKNSHTENKNKKRQFFHLPGVPGSHFTWFVLLSLWKHIFIYNLCVLKDVLLKTNYIYTKCFCLVLQAMKQNKKWTKGSVLLVYLVKWQLLHFLQSKMFMYHGILSFCS